MNHGSCLDKSNPQPFLFCVEQRKQSVSIASISQGRVWEATGVCHLLTGFKVTSSSALALRAFAVEVPCPNHLHPTLMVTSQKACPSWWTGDPLVTSGPLRHSCLPLDWLQQLTQQWWVTTWSSWQCPWVCLFIYFSTGHCYKRSIPKLYMEWFSLFRDSQPIALTLRVTISLGLLIGFGQNISLLLIPKMTSEWAQL